MALISWHLDELTGATLTLRLYPIGSGIIANPGGDVMDEEGEGLFVVNVEESLAGWHKAYVDEAGSIVASGWVDMTNGQQVVNEAVLDLSTIPRSAVVGRFDDPNADNPNITWYIGEVAKTKTVRCVDSLDAPIDLTQYEEFYLVIERLAPNRTDVQVIEFADLEISGGGNNELTFQADAAVLARADDFEWALRLTDESVIASGRITVTYKPMRDPTP